MTIGNLTAAGVVDENLGRDAMKRLRTALVTLLVVFAMVTLVTYSILARHSAPGLIHDENVTATPTHGVF